MIKKFFSFVRCFLAEYWKDIVCVVFIALLCIGCFVGGVVLSYTELRDHAMLWEKIATEPEPERCSLCECGINYHAPCLVNLSSGELVELAVYEPHPNVIGEVSDTLQTGFIAFNYGAGTNTVRNPATETCEATLPKDNLIMNPAHFCFDCRQKITETAIEGYILADMYDLENIDIYKVTDGATYTIRDYLVTVRIDENKYTVVESHGLLDVSE